MITEARKAASGMFVCLCLVLSVLSLISCGSSPEKTNIVFILADDLGWTDLGIMGSSFYQTPRLAACGLTSSTSRVLDGRSLLPLFSGQDSWKREALYWHFPAYLEGEAEGARDPLFRTRPAAAVRSGDWKLIEYFEDGALELYYLSDDVGESNNLAFTLPDKTRELHEKMKEWRRSLQAPVPTQVNPEYDSRK